MPSEKIKIKDKGHWNENAFQPTFVLFNEEKASGKKNTRDWPLVIVSGEEWGEQENFVHVKIKFKAL